MSSVLAFFIGFAVLLLPATAIATLAAHMIGVTWKEADIEDFMGLGFCGFFGALMLLMLCGLSVSIGIVILESCGL